MHRNRGILYLDNPLQAQQKKHISNAHAPVFNENGRCLSRAQWALYELRRECTWVCAAAEGPAVWVALALAAQLPVNRLALRGTWLKKREGLSREMLRLRGYALRNLMLITAEILLIEPGEGEVRRLLRGINRPKICVTEGPVQREMLLAPWETLNENNLLIPWKCV